MFLAILLLACGMSFAAFFIWLIIRTINRRERWAKRTLIAILATTPVLYVLSVGPAERLRTSGLLPEQMQVFLISFYSPLVWFFKNAPGPIQDSLNWYGKLWRG